MNQNSKPVPTCVQLDEVVDPEAVTALALEGFSFPDEVFIPEADNSIGEP